MLRQGFAAIGKRRDDLHFRMHLLSRLRRQPPQRGVPQLRRQFRAATAAAGGKTSQQSAVDPAYFQSRRLRPLTSTGVMPVAKMRALIIGAIGLLSIIMAWCASAAADDYPSRPIRLII